jgi:hypothetical protein
VFDLARSLIQTAAVTEDQRRSLLIGLESSRRELLDKRMPACVCLPVLAYSAVCPDLERALPLAASTTVLNAGRHLLDDLVDGHLDASGYGTNPANAVLIGVGLLSVLPLVGLLDLQAPVEMLLRLQPSTSTP